MDLWRPLIAPADSLCEPMSENLVDHSKGEQVTRSSPEKEKISELPSLYGIE